MNVTLYEMRHSPYCIPISRSLDALGIGFERIEVPNGDRSLIIRLTNGAYYQVPVLVHGEHIVYESSGASQEVAHYVDSKFSGGRLFPERYEGLQDILIDHIENDIEAVGFKLCDIHYVDSLDLIERTHVIRHKERKFGVGCVEQWKAQEAELQRSMIRYLGQFESMLRASPYLLTDTPLYVDFSLFGVVGNFSYNEWNEIPDSLPLVRDWYTRMMNYRF